MTAPAWWTCDLTDLSEEDLRDMQEYELASLEAAVEQAIPRIKELKEIVHGHRH